jgi:hypothetical protein
MDRLSKRQSTRGKREAREMQTRGQGEADVRQKRGKRETRERHLCVRHRAALEPTVEHLGHTPQHTLAL